MPLLMMLACDMHRDGEGFPLPESSMPRLVDSSLSKSVVSIAGRLHPERALHRQINLLVSRLDGTAAPLVRRAGSQPPRPWRHPSPGGHHRPEREHTIRRGRRELARARCRPVARARAGARRRPPEPPNSTMASCWSSWSSSPRRRDGRGGDPMGAAVNTNSGVPSARWSARLTAAGHPASPPTVTRLLRRLGYSPKANVRRTEARSSPPERDAQFRQIAAQRAAFQQTGDPIISVDAKKKELIGNFKNAGRPWCQTAEAVLIHDWPQDAIGQAIPYEIYELTTNRGYVCVGDCHDTLRFAVEVIADWWRDEGQARFAEAQRLLILADAGGSNSARSRVWKARLQDDLCDAQGLTVTVCHYPTGCSKWNPVEHRLFGPISLNWAGVPLRTFETAVGYISGTTTRTGLQVTGVLKRGGNETGERVSDAAMQGLQLTPHAVCPQWSYTLRPRFDVVEYQ